MAPTINLPVGTGWWISISLHWGSKLILTKPPMMQKCNLKLARNLISLLPTDIVCSSFSYYSPTLQQTNCLLQLNISKHVFMHSWVIMPCFHVGGFKVYWLQLLKKGHFWPDSGQQMGVSGSHWFFASCELMALMDTSFCAQFCFSV